MWWCVLALFVLVVLRFLWCAWRCYPTLRGVLNCWMFEDLDTLDGKQSLDAALRLHRKRLLTLRWRVPGHHKLLLLAGGFAGFVAGIVIKRGGVDILQWHQALSRDRSLLEARIRRVKRYPDG